ncbi:MAG: hypothetical protein ABSE18_02255 [Minisyncoccia bacterium]|jgi:hypothetical protein
MNAETKTCQNCKSQFTIEPEDFDFYKRIAVPPPTWCPECRMIRRLSYRNERSFHRRTCNAPGHTEEIISIYDASDTSPVYDYEYWWGDTWDPLAYGAQYDFGKDFFSQWRDLRNRVPRLALSNARAVNSEYCNVNDKSKDCYMISAAYENEHVLYSNRVSYSKDSADCYILNKGELCYGNVACTDSYRLLFSIRSKNCTNSAFLYDCDNCQDCFGCANLRNKRFCLFNKQFTKEEFLKQSKQFDLRSFLAIERAASRFRELSARAIHRHATLISTVDSTGDNLSQCKHCRDCFDFVKAEECKFCNWGGFVIKDSYDANGVGDVSELVYETFDEVRGSRILFSSVVYDSHDVAYSMNCYNSNNLFGCVGLRKKQYCILNRQYSKEEYESLIPKIIAHMHAQPYRDGRGLAYAYGEFFPPELSTFGYNETVAHDLVRMTQKEARALGFQWRESSERDYVISIQAAQLPDDLDRVKDSITKEVIGCNHGGKCDDQCTAAFRIIPDELRLHRNLGVALPRLCFNCRHHARLCERNPLKLWHRRCRCAGTKSEANIYLNTTDHFHGAEHCPNEFETSYAPDRPEIIYCEQCYQAEVV